MRLAPAAAALVLVSTVLAGCADDGPGQGGRPDGPGNAGSSGAPTGPPTTPTTSARAGPTGQTPSSPPPSSPAATCGFLASQPCTCPWVDGCPIPEWDPDADIEFLFNASYHPGERVPVRIHNRGAATYAYGTVYESCNIQYFTDTGRRFLVPPGTHCDLPATSQIAPGETKHLFWWDLDECAKDNWGCAERKPLPPGTYHLRDQLCAAKPDHGNDCAAAKSLSGATVRITAG